MQCLQGFAVPESACTFDMLAPPNFDDCRSYCPFVLTVRAVPRKLQDGETVRTNHLPTYLLLTTYHLQLTA